MLRGEAKKSGSIWLVIFEQESELETNAVWTCVQVLPLILTLHNYPGIHTAI